MINKLKIVVNVLIVTSIIALAISYLTQIFTVLPKLNFLEAVGVYCIWTPIHHFLNSLGKDNMD